MRAVGRKAGSNSAITVTTQSLNFLTYNDLDTLLLCLLYHSLTIIIESAARPALRSALEIQGALPPRAYTPMGGGRIRR